MVNLLEALPEFLQIVFWHIVAGLIVLRSQLPKRIYLLIGIFLLALINAVNYFFFQNVVLSSVAAFLVFVMAVLSHVLTKKKGGNRGVNGGQKLSGNVQNVNYGGQKLNGNVQNANYR